MQLTAFSSSLMFNPSLQPAKPATMAEIPASPRHPIADTFQRQNGLIAPLLALRSGSVGSTFEKAEQFLETELTDLMKKTFTTLTDPGLNTIQFCEPVHFIIDKAYKQIHPKENTYENTHYDHLLALIQSRGYGKRAR